MNAESISRARPGLKLRARDADDLQTIAACLQDALVPLADAVFLKAEKRFVMVANRFRWEGTPGAAPGPDPDDEPEPNPAPEGDARPEPEGDARFEDANGEPGVLYERVNCGLSFDKVKNVKVRGLDTRDRRRILSILTLTSSPGAITIVFSGGAEIRLEADRICCHLEDLGEPWPTRWRPTHESGDAEAAEDR